MSDNSLDRVVKAILLGDGAVALDVTQKALDNGISIKDFKQDSKCYIVWRYTFSQVESLKANRKFSEGF